MRKKFNLSKGGESQGGEKPVQEVDTPQNTPVQKTPKEFQTKSKKEETLEDVY